MVKERKKREEPEAEFVAAYVSKFYPEDYAIFRVSLGEIETELAPEELSEAEMAMIGRTRRWADCIIIRDQELILIEGAIRPALGDVSTIQGYARLIKATPELAKYKGLPIRMELVGAVYDPVVEHLCSESGVKYVIYQTPEVLGYLERIAPRFRRGLKPSGFE